MSNHRDLFREEPYTKEFETTVLAADGDGIRLQQSIFYPTGGGQPGDRGTLTRADGRVVTIIDTHKGSDDLGSLHRVEAGTELPAAGETVTMRIDWPRRHRHMRMHTCLHLLCTLVDSEVTGGAVSDTKGRLDFNLPDQGLDKADLEARLQTLIAADHPVRTRWISDEELAAQPELVRTMSVQPPTGQGRIRLVQIEGVDLQPCGGTHVASTGEIGAVRIGKIENKGRQNRRVNILFDD